MSTLAELRAVLRVLLNDTGAEGYLWPDAALNRHLEDAGKAYSRYCPRERVGSIATVAEQAEYDLPADCERVLRVDLVEGAGVEGDTPLLLMEGGDSHGVGYELFAGKLVLRPTPGTTGETVKLRYLAPHASLVAESDPSTVPAGDEDLLLLAAAAKAVEGLATEEAKRRRFEEGGGQPAASTANGYWRQFQEGVQLRRRRVRASSLVVR